MVHEKHPTWVNYLLLIFWAYCAIKREPTQVASFPYMNGIKIVIPNELVVRSLRITLEEEIPINEHFWIEAIEERKETVKEAHVVSTSWVSKAYHKIAWPWSLREGDQVLMASEHVIKNLN